MSARAPRLHCVFDLDGTLVDSIPGIDAAARLALSELAPEVSPPSLRSFIGPPIRTMMERALRWTDAERLDELERRFRAHYDGGAWRQTAPYPDVQATLLALRERRVRLHILTNKPAVPTARIIDHLGWTPLFDTVVCPQSRTPPFPDKPAAALHLRDHLGLPAADTLLIGDSADDHAAAHAAGFAFAAASWGYGDAALRAPASALATCSVLLNLPDDFPA